MIAVLALIAGCGSAEPPSAPGAITSSFEQQRTDGVKALLASWSAALLADDLPALRALFDPAATEQFVDAEVARAANLTELPFATFAYTLGTGPESTVPAALADRLADATDTFAPPVTLDYQFDGADVAPTSKPVALVVARRGDSWKLVSDDAFVDEQHSADEQQGGDSAHTTWRGPWDFGPVSWRQVETAGTVSLVLGHADRQALIDDLSSELVTAVPAVTDFWGLGWSRRAVVFVASSDAEFAADTGTAAANVDIAASTVADPVTSAFASGQRIVFGPAAQDRLTPTTTRTVLRHELTHVAARTATVNGSPLWVLEGFADYSGYRGESSSFAALAPTLAAVVRAGGPPRVLPIDTDFGAGGARGAIAYESAWSVWKYMAVTYGEPAIRTLYRALAVGPLDATTENQALIGALGVNEETLLGAWGRWVSEQVGG